MVNTLFDFAEAKPTCVVAEKAEVAGPRVVGIYMASEQGFTSYCEGCAELAMVQETGGSELPLRVFCKAMKCSK